MKSSNRLPYLLAILCLGACPWLSAIDEAAELEVLQNLDATLAERQAACRNLARVGTAAAVPGLAELLDDEVLSHMARNALEPIPGPEVDAALREALGKLNGRPLMGVVASLGVRGDEKAIPEIAKLLGSDELELARTAARALGDIGTAAAAEALGAGLDKVVPERRQAVCEGIFRCAEALAEKGEPDLARGLYDRVREIKDAPHQIRAAALRGAVLTRGGKGIPLLRKAVMGKDDGMGAAAARIAMEVPGSEATVALALALPWLPPERQILIIQTLGMRGDPACAPMLVEFLESGETAVRVASVKALTRLGYTAVVPALTTLALAAEGELSEVAKDSLAGFPGQAADGAISALLADKDANARCLGVELIGGRASALALPVLLKAAASDRDDAVRLASLKVLRDLAGAGDLPGLLEILLKSDSEDVIQGVTRAVVAVCGRQPVDGVGDIVIKKALYGDLPDGKFRNVTKQVAKLVKQRGPVIEASNTRFGDPAPGVPKKLTVEYFANGVRGSRTVAEKQTLRISTSQPPSDCVDPIVAAVGKARGPAKLALLRVLRSLGGVAALKAVGEAAADSDPKVVKAAQRILCEWQTPDAIESVAALAKSPPDPSTKVSALRGWMRLIPLRDATPEQTLAEVKSALALSERKEEKWIALGVLGEIPLPGALEVVMSQLDEPGLLNEACMAAVAIAKRIAAKHPEEVHEAMQAVAAKAKDGRVVQQAMALAEKTAPVEEVPEADEKDEKDGTDETDESDKSDDAEAKPVEENTQK